MKICTKCGEEKALEMFHKHTSSKDGLRPDCKSCFAEQQRQRRAKMTPEERERNLKQMRENSRKWRRANKLKEMQRRI